jgi:hypothetical protein
MTSPAMMRWGTWRNNSKLSVNHPWSGPSAVCFSYNDSFVLLINIAIAANLLGWLLVWVKLDAKH